MPGKRMSLRETRFTSPTAGKYGVAGSPGYDFNVARGTASKGIEGPAKSLSNDSASNGSRYKTTPEAEEKEKSREISQRFKSAKLP